MNTLALILARGGSKGIPRKNIKIIAGKPLIAWSIEAALASKLCNAVVVSTEDEEIASVARSWGAQVPFIRPSVLAQDDTPSLDPVLHALDQLSTFDAVLLLQPTSPLRTAEDIDTCLDLAQARHASSVVSVSEADQHPLWMYSLGSDERLHLLPIDQGASVATRRQDLPPVYSLNGAIYYAHANWLRQHRSFATNDTLAYVMPKERSLDLDTMLDWKIAELLLQERT